MWKGVWSWGRRDWTRVDHDNPAVTEQTVDATGPSRVAIGTRSVGVITVSTDVRGRPGFH